MDDDILDFVTNNWGQILGIPKQPPAGQGYGGGPIPNPPATAMPSGAAFSPSGVADVNPVTGLPKFLDPSYGSNPYNDPNAPVPQAGAPPAPPGAVPNSAGFNDPMSGLPMPPPPLNFPQGSPQAGAPSGAPGVPGTAAAAVPPGGGVPTPPPQNFPQGSPQAGAPPSGGNMAFAGPPSIPTANGPAPMGAQPPPAPPPGRGGINPSTMGSLAASLGLTPNGANITGDFLGGLGRGLENVGKLRRGAAPAQAFAAGAGGGLTGYQAQEHQAKTDLFNQSSTAFRDMLAAQTADNNTALSRAHAEYFSARAKEMALGGKGTNAWQNTPYGKVIGVENEAMKFQNQQRLLLDGKWKNARDRGSPPTPEEEDEDRQRMQKNVDDYRSRLYKQAGIDPQQAEKLKNMGASSDNPFDTKGMSLDQFNSQVPMGGWFKDQNGVVRQRTVAPPDQGGGGTQSAQQQQPQQRSQQWSDDELAAAAAA